MLTEKRTTSSLQDKYWLNQQKLPSAISVDCCFFFVSLTVSVILVLIIKKANRRFIKGYTGHPLLGGVATRACCTTPQRKGVREAVCEWLWVLRRKTGQIVHSRWFLRNKSYRWILLKLSWIFSTKHCFEECNKNDRSPLSFKRCDGPILPHLCLYLC